MLVHCTQRSLALWGVRMLATGGALVRFLVPTQLLLDGGVLLLDYRLLLLRHLCHPLFFLLLLLILFLVHLLGDLLGLLLGLLLLHLLLLLFLLLQLIVSEDERVEHDSLLQDALCRGHEFGE